MLLVVINTQKSEKMRTVKTGAFPRNHKILQLLVAAAVVVAAALSLARLPTSLSSANAVSTQTTLAGLAKGQVIALPSGDVALGDYKMMFTGITKSGYGLFVMLDNYCNWPSAECVGRLAQPNSTGTPWNYTGDVPEEVLPMNVTHYSQQISTLRKPYNYLNQTDNFYKSLPLVIGGQIAKSEAVPIMNFENLSINRSSGAGVTCSIGNGNSNNVPFGEVETTFTTTDAATATAETCYISTRVTIPSYQEWKGEVAPSVYPAEDVDTTFGATWCEARFGATGDGTWNEVAGGCLADSSLMTSINHLWSRSARADGGLNVWALGTRGNLTCGNEIYGEKPFCIYGVAPELYLDLGLYIYDDSVAGTWQEPFVLGEMDAKTVGVPATGARPD
jgi:hypothetical protein